MKMISITKNRIYISLGIFLLYISVFRCELQAQHYFSKNNFHYLSQYSISGGLLVNQANHKHVSYQPNNKALFNFNINAIRIKHFSIDLGGGYRKKSLIGYGNYGALKLFNNPEPSPILAPPYFKIDFSYLTADATFRITFLQKYMFQPFIFAGVRYNKILSYSDSIDFYNNYLFRPFYKRDKYINSFFGLGCNYSLNSNINLNIFFEENNDLIFPNERNLLYTIPNVDKEIRFLSYSFQIGIQYTLPKATNTLKRVKPIE